MPVQAPPQSLSDDLNAALDTQGEREYVQLLSMLQHTQGIFALMLVRSNFTPALRDRLLERLAADLAPLPLSIVRVTKTKYNAAQLLAEAAQFTSAQGVLALVGLEDTPDMVVEGGQEQRRPPALASLNNGREALRRACRLPVLVWCNDWVYKTLRGHAPDFFDHFAGLFHFQNANPLSTAHETHVMVTVRNGEDAEEKLLSRSTGDQRRICAAVDFYTAEVASYTEPTPQRAEMLLGLAEALQKQATGNRTSHIQRAQEAATEALSLLSLEAEPYRWARGQNTLGIIYSELPIGNRSENLQRAIACYEAALRVAREDTMPHEWAMTLTNLGNVYSILSSGDRVENLQRSIACYEAALRVYGEDTMPYEWAGIQNNLGHVYATLPFGDKGENLSKAIACFEAALRVQREETLPQEWAKTLTNLGIALKIKGDVRGARNAWTDAVRGYAAVGMEEAARKIQDWINTLPTENVDGNEIA